MFYCKRVNCIYTSPTNSYFIDRLVLCAYSIDNLTIFFNPQPWDCKSPIFFSLSLFLSFSLSLSLTLSHSLSLSLSFSLFPNNPDLIVFVWKASTDGHLRIVRKSFGSFGFGGKFRQSDSNESARPLREISLGFGANESTRNANCSRWKAVLNSERKKLVFIKRFLFWSSVDQS